MENILENGAMFDNIINGDFICYTEKQKNI